MNEEKFYCSVCGKEISKEEYECYAGVCWECWDDQMTEECEFEEKKPPKTTSYTATCVELLSAKNAET